MTPDSIIYLENASIIQNNSIVLSNINLNVNKGEFIYLIGKVGSGKSSIIRVLNAELALSEGTGMISGFDLKRLKKRQIPYLRRKLGIVFQDFQLLIDRSVHDNLLFVLKATGWNDKVAMQKRVQEVLEKVELETKGFKMPHQLSGGEQQRVVIARALLNDPELILADEPTGNLDPESSEGILQLLIDISKTGRAIVMATHDYSLFKNFPARTIKCENGKIIEEKSAFNYGNNNSIN